MNKTLLNLSANNFLDFINSINSIEKIENNELELLYKPSEFTLKNLYYALFISNINADSSFSYKLQKLNAYCIIYTLSGEGSISFNNSSFILKPNYILFFDCNIPHIIKSNDSSWNFKVLFINGSNISSFYEIFSENSSVVSSLSHISNIPNLIEVIFKYCYSCSEYYEFILSNLLNNLLTYLIIDKEKKLNSKECIPKYIKEIKLLFDENYQNSYTLDELSRLYNINKYKIVRDFTKYISKSPIEYLICKKMNAAQVMLISTTSSIHEISLNVGIENVNHFINLFKKHTGLSPLNYRKSYS